MIDAPPDLLSFLKQEYDRCFDQTLEDERTNAIDRYNGEPYGDEEPGTSQVVSRDTAETVDYMVISILRTIISGERVVEFIHENVEAAHEATETIMYMLMDQQDGYRILHDWLKAGLLEKNAVAMTYPETQPKKRVESTIPTALFDEQRYIEAEETEPDPITGTPMLNVVELQPRDDKFCDAAVPNEEFYCSTDARTINEAALKGRKVRKRLSDLVGMGFARDDVETISGASGQDSRLSQARDEDRNTSMDQRAGYAREVWFHEEFCCFDLDEDGVAELLYIQRSEDWKILGITPMENEDDHPFEDWCPFPMQHRRIGQSLADKVMDLERISTVLLRQSLNGIYLANNPSTYVHEESIGDNTIDDLLTVRPGRLVRWKGSQPPVERQGNFDASAGFEMLEYMGRARETRTGITRLNQGLDEDTLNQTAKGQAQLIARGEQVEEYVARNFANAVARLITKKARLLQHQGKILRVPIDGEYKDVDPTKWPEDMIARARVGLGVSNKEQRLVFRREVMNMQAQALQAGLPIVDPQKFYNSAKGFIKDASLGSAATYFNEPPKDEQGNPIPEPPKPDPEMAKVQAQVQLDAQKLHGQQAESAPKIQLQREEAAQKQQLAREEAEFEAQLATAKAEREAVLAEQKMAMEERLALRKLAMEEHMTTRRQELSERELSSNRPGGSLAE